MGYTSPMSSLAVSMIPQCCSGNCRSELGRASNDCFSGSFHSDADSSGISSSELSDVALTELMVSRLTILLSFFLLASDAQ